MGMECCKKEKEKNEMDMQVSLDSYVEPGYLLAAWAEY